MANLTFKTGAKAKFPDTKTPGQLSFITDGATGSIYLDIDANNRVKFNADAKKLDHTVQIILILMVAVLLELILGVGIESLK